MRASEGRLSAWKTPRATVEDVARVRRLLERALRLYMSEAETVRHLRASANVDPAFTHSVWARLRRDEPEFFVAYDIAVRVKRQIIRFNALQEKYLEALKAEGATEGATEARGDAGTSDVESAEVGEFDFKHEDWLASPDRDALADLIERNFTSSCDEANVETLGVAR